MIQSLKDSKKEIIQPFKLLALNLMGRIMPVRTANFNSTTDPKLLCTCGHPSCDKRSVNLSTLRRVQRVRDLANRPLTITSGGRCSLHPNESHRTTPADHQKRQAVDIKVSDGVERAQLVEYGIECGFNAIGVAKTFVHLGYREGERFVMWVY